jgi:hypothetical protein
MKFQLLFILFFPVFALSAPNLPKCIDDEATINNIKSQMAANPKNSKKYDGYREALKNDLDTELQGRLIFAETKASKCPEKNLKLIPFISGVIANRIAKKGGKVRDVIFQRDQFASSLNNYSESFYREFLCPKDLGLWKSILQQVSLPTELPKNAVNYFLYKHHPDWTKEPWNLPETAISQNSDVRDCLRVFENKDYK